MFKGKVFGIGMSRTGTSSLSAALRVLGYKTIHFPRSMEQIEESDAATDATVACRFKELDRRYPGSKFILTVRDMDLWLESMELLMGRENIAPEEWASYERLYFYGKVGLGTGDETLMENAYWMHFRNAVDYFKGRRPDLLTLEICAGEGWKKLCEFLEKPVPDHPFPHLNKGCADHYKNHGTPPSGKE